MTTDERCGFFLRQADCQHGAFSASAFVHQACSQHNDAGTFLKTEDSSDTRRGDLADAMADNGGWMDSD